MSMVDRVCRCCKSAFKARQADVNRGWALYCSKSCKATHTYGNKPKKKKQYKRHDGKSPMKFKFCWCGDNAVNGLYSITGIEWLCYAHIHEASSHPFSSDALGQW